MGLSCKGFEEDPMALLAAIEASHHNEEWASNAKPDNNGKRELKRLSCSINYDSKCGSSSCSRVKGRSQSVLYEASIVILECKRVE